jgi:diaminopimelate epimerase
VQMPGGSLHIEIGEDFSILLSGPVTKVGYGTVYDEIFG